MKTQEKTFFGEYSDLKVLIIDDNTLVQDALKHTLYNMDIREVRCAQNAYFGLKLCSETKFHIIICAFNVKSDKDGFHLLEELKFKGYVTKTTVLIFLCTETKESLVNSIIELQPDDFWVKPLQPLRVQKRLEHTLKIKNQLFNIYQALDQREFSKVIYYADRHLLNKKLASFHPNILRMKGTALLSLLEFQEAENFYKELLNTYKYSWVYIGYARALLKQGRIEDIEDLIKTLVNRPETRFATHDMLAQYHIENEKYDLAYQEIKKATALAPRNIDRNKKSWDLARLNHDHQGQYQATKSIAKNAKNSIHDSPELLLNVIRSGIDLAVTITNGGAEQILQQTDKYIQQLEAEYEDADLFKEQINVARARVFNARNESAKAQRIVDNQVSIRPTALIEDNLDKVKVYHELGMREEAMLLLESIKNQISGDSLTSQVVNRYIQQETQERSDIHFTPKQLHDMAVEHFQKQRLQPALEAVLQAIQLAPTSVKFSISLLKILVMLKQNDEFEEQYLENANKALALFEQTKLDEKTQGSVAQVKEKWLSLMATTEQENEH
ncbi:response regulator [Thalassotalea insulae]|uniref:Response regulator n=1 Tax=Thalassotalea insulae TaxID=2056778 RepID=A0ABQ6GTY9_9GAMM|nr:response regulator [Thalassotalea insulae]GLX78155.1 response regulator [Thalassotalea insulae]